MSNAREADNNWDENSGRRRKQRQFRQPNAVALVRNPPAVRGASCGCYLRWVVSRSAKWTSRHLGGSS